MHIFADNIFGFHYLHDDVGCIQIYFMSKVIIILYNEVFNLIVFIVFYIFFLQLLII